MYNLIEENGKKYLVEIFNQSGLYKKPKFATKVDVLIVGCGGYGMTGRGGGGGAGAVIYVPDYEIGGDQVVTIGALSTINQRAASSFFGEVEAYGGGNGESDRYYAQSGGSGGGGAGIDGQTDGRKPGVQVNLPLNAEIYANAGGNGYRASIGPAYSTGGGGGGAGGAGGNASYRVIPGGIVAGIAGLGGAGLDFSSKFGKTLGENGVVGKGGSYHPDSMSRFVGCGNTGSGGPRWSGAYSITESGHPGVVAVRVELPYTNWKFVFITESGMGLRMTGEGWNSFEMMGDEFLASNPNVKENFVNNGMDLDVFLNLTPGNFEELRGYGSVKILQYKEV